MCLQIKGLQDGVFMMSTDKIGNIIHLGIKEFHIDDNILYPIVAMRKYRIEKTKKVIWVTNKLTEQVVDMEFNVIEEWNGPVQTTGASTKIKSLGMHVSVLPMPSNKAKDCFVPTFNEREDYTINVSVPVIFYNEDIQLIDVMDAIVKRLIIPSPEYLSETFPDYPFNVEYLYGEIWNSYLKYIKEDK